MRNETKMTHRLASPLSSKIASNVKKESKVYNKGKLVSYFLLKVLVLISHLTWWMIIAKIARYIASFSLHVKKFWKSNQNHHDKRRLKKMSIKMSSLSHVSEVHLFLFHMWHFSFREPSSAPEIDDFNMIVSLFFMFRICNRCTLLKLIETKNPLLCTTKRKPWRCHLRSSRIFKT